MKYIIVDERKDGNGDFHSTETDVKEIAIRAAQTEWGYLTDREKAQRTVYVLESINPDEEAIDHFDGNVIWRAE